MSRSSWATVFSALTFVSAACNPVESTPDARASLDGGGPDASAIDADESDANSVDANSVDANSVDASDARSDPSADAPSPSSARTYVIGTLTIPSDPDLMGRVPGVNLDMLDSDGSGTGCVGATPDYVSLGDEPGTDNQFVGYLVSVFSAGFGTDVQAAADSGITSGVQLVAARVTDIDSFVNDPSVSVEFLLVKPADCTASSCPVSGVLAGQAWRQRAAPITPTPVSGEIVAGQLRVSLPTFPLVLVEPTRRFSLSVHNVVVRAEIRSDGLVNGTLAGALRNDELLVQCELVMPGISATIRPLIESSADLEPLAASPDRCASTSMGIGFAAVRALSVAPL